MRFGIFTGLGQVTWDEVAALWRHVEGTGWDAACVTDHRFIGEIAPAFR